MKATIGCTVMLPHLACVTVPINVSNSGTIVVACNANKFCQA